MRTQSHDLAKSDHVIRQFRMVVLLVFEQYQHDLTKDERVIKTWVLRNRELAVDIDCG